MVRKFTDSSAHWVFTIGGISVILSIALIGFFLFYMVFPMFASAHIEAVGDYNLPATSRQVYYATDDYQETAYEFDKYGSFTVFSASNGRRIAEPVNFTNGVEITSHAIVTRNQHLHAFGLADGGIRIAQADFQLTYPDGVREVITTLKLPYGDGSLEPGLEDESIESIAFAENSGQAKALTWQPNSGLIVHEFLSKTNLLTGEQQLAHEDSRPIAGFSSRPLWMGVDQLLAIAYILTPQKMHAFALGEDGPQALAAIPFPLQLGKATTASFLLGNISVLVGFDSGAILQIFGVRNEQGETIPRIIRNFPKMRGAITGLAPEYIRRGFAAGDDMGNIGIYYSTNGARVGKFALESPVANLEMAPRHDGLLAQLDDHSMRRLRVENEHPEVSITSLWLKIWYEFYPEPDFVWQSTSGSSDFEPKLSLAPLTFGTLKAAFYALLLAVPIAIMAAIYTAFFLSSRLRQTIKPVIELMEALPTVILGFLAGLWLAPYIEKNLTFLFTFVLLLPPLTIAFGFGVHLLTRFKPDLPSLLQKLISEEWRILMIIPLIILLILLTQWTQHPLENFLFGGPIHAYISNDLGIGYDQRNAIIIGLALGFAVIPSIFSITEDAIFSVPANLVSGSLALGASRWQTLVGVVLPTASPGIFSAVMIGMGRAVGETMIVLMATGNTPIMEWNIFEGLRTLSANIAVEMPESEVGSSHYRILFLSGLVLFIFTFILNTIAEIVRQNLRKKYGS